MSALETAVEAEVGKVIVFSGQGRPAKPGRPTGSPGQLLMFTGVRYERGTVAAQPGPVTPRPADPRRTRG